MSKCVNCGNDGVTKSFVGAIVCEPCFALASSKLEQIHRQLEQMKNMAIEAIRVGLIESRIHVQDAGASMPAIDKKGVLKEIVKQATRKQNNCEPSRGR